MTKPWLMEFKMINLQTAEYTLKIKEKKMIQQASTFC